MSQANICSAELLERTNVSDTLAVFRFRRDERLLFSAGQYATLGLETDGGLIERPYSIVSSPHERFLEFFIELIPNGTFTRKLWELKLGSSILIRQRIVGHFTLDSTVTRHLMLATATGVAPFVSMARSQRIERDLGRLFKDELLLIHGASHSAHFGPYLDELKDLSRAVWLNYVPTVSRPWQDPKWKDETGRVEEVLRKYADRLGFDHTNAVAYACGHPQMVKNVKAILLRSRFQYDRIKEEEYFAIHRAPPGSQHLLATETPQ